MYVRGIEKARVSNKAGDHDSTYNTRIRHISVFIMGIDIKRVMEDSECIDGCYNTLLNVYVHDTGHGV